MESRAAVARVFGVGIRDSMPGIGPRARARDDSFHLDYQRMPKDGRTNQLHEEHLRR